MLAGVMRTPVLLIAGVLAWTPVSATEPSQYPVEMHARVDGTYELTVVGETGADDGRLREQWWRRAQTVCGVRPVRGTPALKNRLKVDQVLQVVEQRVASGRFDCP